MHGSSNSGTYYRDREKAERERAEQAASDHSRQIHLDLAERYRELAEQSEMIAGLPADDRGACSRPEQT